MKFDKVVLISACIGVLLLSCKKEGSDKEAASRSYDGSSGAQTEEIILQDPPASVSGTQLPEPEKKVIKSADVKMKVRDVEKTTRLVEELTHSLGGFVAESNIQSILNSNTRIVELSADSTLNINSYTKEIPLY